MATRGRSSRHQTTITTTRTVTNANKNGGSIRKVSGDRARRTAVRATAATATASWTHTRRGSQLENVDDGVRKRAIANACPQSGSQYRTRRSQNEVRQHRIRLLTYRRGSPLMSKGYDYHVCIHIYMPIRRSVFRTRRRRSWTSTNGRTRATTT